MKTLLSINGGGLFGIGPANWVPKLKWKFDYYAGTSVGSILAACYACGMPPLKVQEMFNGDLPKKIFTLPSLPRNPFREATYDSKGAAAVLKEVFGDRRVHETDFPVVIVAWDYDDKRPKVFTSRFNRTYLLRDAVLASMSAPTYFPPFRTIEDNGKPEVLGDGGVCGNDPSLAGIAAMRDDGLPARDIKCLNINTGGVPRKEDLKVSTQVGWLPVIIDIVTLGNSSYTAYGISHLLDDRYMTASPPLPKGKLDDFSLVPAIREAWEKYPYQSAWRFLNGVPE